MYNVHIVSSENSLYLLLYWIITKKKFTWLCWRNRKCICVLCAVIKHGGVCQNTRAVLRSTTRSGVSPNTFRVFWQKPKCFISAHSTADKFSISFIFYVGYFVIFCKGHDVMFQSRQWVLDGVSSPRQSRAYQTILYKMLTFKSMSIFGRFTIFGSQCIFLFGDFSAISALNCWKFQSKLTDIVAMKTLHCLPSWILLRNLAAFGKQETHKNTQGARTNDNNCLIWSDFTALFLLEWELVVVGAR
jgi:hypothetical protein